MIGLAMELCLGFFGLAGGIAVGAGVVALFVVLDIIPRLAQLSRSYSKVRWYEGAMVAGSLFGTIADFWSWKFFIAWKPVSAFVGLLNGIFIGMLAAALTEVLNVLPILAKRVHLQKYLFLLLLAMVFGKVAGSFFDWFVYHPE